MICRKDAVDHLELDSDLKVFGSPVEHVTDSPCQVANDGRDLADAVVSSLKH